MSQFKIMKNGGGGGGGGLEDLGYTLKMKNLHTNLLCIHRNIILPKNLQLKLKKVFSPKKILLYAYGIGWSVRWVYLSTNV